MFYFTCYKDCSTHHYLDVYIINVLIFSGSAQCHNFYVANTGVRHIQLPYVYANKNYGPKHVNTGNLEIVGGVYCALHIFLSEEYAIINELIA